MGKQIGKSVISMCLAMIMVLTLNVYPVQAATETGKVPIICYTIPTGRVTTYTAVNGSYSGYIDGATDKCTILKVYNSGWVQVKYPVSRGYKTAYTQSSNFFSNVDFSATETKIGKNKTVYRRSNLSQSIGTVYGSDNVIVVGTSGGNTQIIYPISGGYKMGWISGNYGSNGGNNAEIKKGYYQIKSAINTDYVLDVYGASYDDGANIQLYKNYYQTNQGFMITKQNDGYYIITAIHSGKALDVENNGSYNGTNILQWSKHGGNNQKWQIIKTSDGYYSFISKANGLYLDVNGGNASNGVNIQCYVGNGTKAQKFILEECSVDEKGNSNSSQASEGTTSFQLPLSGARCSWRSSNNWSWGENVNGGGYSTARVYHLGVDLIGNNDDVYATAGGTVVKSGWNNANGNYIVIKHNVSGKTIYSFYAHLASRNVSGGTTVSKGQKIGVVGNTGSSSRAKHLHFAMMDTLWSGSYYGYSTYFTGNSRTYNGVTYYNPIYVINNGKLP